MLNESEVVLQSILSFKKIIEVQGDGYQILNKVLQSHPEIYYYIASYSISHKGLLSVMKFSYRNQNYPSNKILFPKAEELDHILNESISTSSSKIVMVVLKNMNFEWKIKCFMEQKISFYPNLISYSYSICQVKSTPFTIFDINFNYRIGSVKLRQMKIKTDEELKRINKLLFSMEMPDLVKCFIAHNYLASTVTYYDAENADPLLRSYLQSAYGALIEHKCVCQGYAQAYKMILNTCGIKCDVVCGKILDDSVELHAWNIVYLNHNKECYHVDVTWDSHNNLVDDTYIFKGDEFFKGKREWQIHYYPFCNDGTKVLENAKLYCTKNRRRLLNAGLKDEWIS